MTAKNSGYPSPPEKSLNTGNLYHYPDSSPVQNHAQADASNMDFIGGERDIRSFNRAHQHSSLVRVLRIAFPLIGVFIIALLLGAYFWSQSSAPQITIEKTTLENNKMVMKNPELNGVDKENRPYNMSAKEAITNPLEPKQVELSGINARVPMQEGLFANILAGTGFYDAEAKTLQLGGSIDVKTEDGMSAKLQNADVNMGLGSLISEDPVTITTEQAVISADSLAVEKNGQRIIFQNRVRMTIYPDKLEQAKNETSQNTQ